MEDSEALAFAQRRERLAFKWAMGSAVGGTVGLMSVTASMKWRPDWLPSSGTPVLICTLIFLISIVVFPLSFLAWLVWMRRRRKLEAGPAAKDTEILTVLSDEPGDRLSFAQKRERLSFKAALIFAGGGTLSMLSTDIAGLWIRWVLLPAALRAHRAGDPLAAERFYRERNDLLNDVITAAIPALVICIVGFGITFIAWLCWMTKRRRLETALRHPD